MMGNRGDQKMVELVIGIEAGGAIRSLNGVERGLKMVDTVLGKAAANDGFLPSKDIRHLDQGLQKLKQRVHDLAAEQKLLNKEAEDYADHLKKIERSGGKISDQQRELLLHKEGTARRAGFAVGRANFEYKKQVHESEKIEREMPWHNVKKWGQQDAKQWAGGKGMGLASRAPGTLLGFVMQMLAEGEQVMLNRASARMGSRMVSTYGKPGDVMVHRDTGQVVGYGQSLAYSSAEAHGLHQGYMRASGSTSAEGGKSSLALMRGYSLPPGAVLQIMRAARQAGVTMGDGETAQTFAQSLRAAGVPKVLSEEFASAFGSVMQGVADSQERVNMKQQAGMMATLSMGMGGAYQQSPGRTANLYQNLHGMIQNPGGGDAGKAFIMRSLGLGTKLSYYEALKQQEKGLTDPTNLLAVIQQLRREVGPDKQKQALALNRLSNGRIKLHAAEKLVKMKDDRFTKESIDKALGKRVDLQAQAARSRKGMGPIQRKIARGEKYADVREKLDPAYEKFVQMQIKGAEATLQAITAVQKEAQEAQANYKILQNDLKEMMNRFLQLGNKIYNILVTIVNWMTGRTLYNWIRGSGKPKPKLEDANAPITDTQK